MPYNTIEKRSAWREKNRVYIREYSRRWREKNASKLKLYASNFYENNKEKVKEYNDSWNKRNPDKRRLIKRVVEARRRAKKTTTCDGTITTKSIVSLLAEQNYRCNLCDFILSRYHLDHIIPLAKGGKHVIGNIQILCIPCNESKGAKLDLEKFI